LLSYGKDFNHESKKFKPGINGNKQFMHNSIVILKDYSLPWQGDLMGAVENAGFNAKVQQNLGLYFVTIQHKSLQKLGSLQLTVSDMLTSLLSHMAG